MRLALTTSTSYPLPFIGPPSGPHLLVSSLLPLLLTGPAPTGPLSRLHSSPSLVSFADAPPLTGTPLCSHLVSFPLLVPPSVFLSSLIPFTFPHLLVTFHWSPISIPPSLDPTPSVVPLYPSPPLSPPLRFPPHWTFTCPPY